MIGQKLTEALMAVAPIDGVLIGKQDDRKTWVIQFRPEATPEQRATAKAALDAFEYVEPVKPAPVEDRLAALEALRAALVEKAVVTAEEIEAKKPVKP